MSATLQPVTDTQREESLDTLRGFAIIGVLYALFFEWENLGVLPGDEKTLAFKFINQAANIFLHSKAFTLLAFLFGYGFTLQVLRSNQKGIDLLPFALRRALGLFILGTLHGVLLRDGDVLAAYAICSLIIILLRKSADKIILIAMLVANLLPALYYLVFKLIGSQPSMRPVEEGTGLIGKNLSHLFQHWYPHFILVHSGTLVLILVGMYAARKRFLEKLQHQSKQINLLILLGLILEVFKLIIPWNKIIPVTADFNAPNFYQNLLNSFLSNTLQTPFKWGIDMVYIAIILHLLRNNSARKMLQPLTNIGKMALTNYLLPDMIVIPFFFLVFNLWAQVPAVQQVIIATAIAIFLGIFSTWWLKRFNFGPFEWLLRSFTYWKWQPMHKKRTVLKKEAAAFPDQLFHNN
jgi:uncharacterized protein